MLKAKKEQTWKPSTVDRVIVQGLLEVEKEKLDGVILDSRQSRAARARKIAQVPVNYAHFGYGGRDGFIDRFLERHMREPTVEEIHAVGNRKGGWITKLEEYYKAAQITPPPEVARYNKNSKLMRASHLFREYRKGGLDEPTADAKLLEALHDRRCYDDGFLVNNMLPRMLMYMDVVRDQALGPGDLQVMLRALQRQQAVERDGGAGPSGTCPGANQGQGGNGDDSGNQHNGNPQSGTRPGANQREGGCGDDSGNHHNGNHRD